jgi:hypothetical protein
MSTQGSLSLLADTRGAAIAEGVIVLPVFILIFASLIYMHGLYSSKISSSTKARGCAWTYSTMGCPEDMPPTCKDSDSGVKENGGALDQFKQVKEFGEVEGLGDGVATGGAIVGGIGAALLGIGDGVTIDSSTEATRPSLFGGGKTAIPAHYMILCNEEPRDLLDVLKAAYCGVRDGLPGC